MLSIVNSSDRVSEISLAVFISVGKLENATFLCNIRQRVFAV